MVRGGRDKEKDASASESLDMELVSDILWAINKIKAQKQRPSDDHICKVVESRTGQSRKEIAKQMELAVKAGHVIKVIFKDRASYKDPRNTPANKAITPVNEWLWMIRAAIDELAEDSGSTLSNIEKLIRKKHGLSSSDVAENMRPALDKGLSVGKLVQVGKCYKNMKDPDRAKKKKPLKLKMPKLLKSRPKATPSKQCGFCLGSAEKNKDGMPEELISCHDCGNSGHPNCLQYSLNLIERIKKEPWQCIECKTCSLCADQGNPDNLLFCDACDKGFHMGCLEPPLSEMPHGSWLCEWCLHPEKYAVQPRKKKKRKPRVQSSDQTWDSSDSEKRPRRKHDRKRKKKLKDSKIPWLACMSVDKILH
jgi:hypothetical protein